MSNFFSDKFDNGFRINRRSQMTAFAINLSRSNDLRFWLASENFIGSGQAEISHEKDVNCMERCKLPEELQRLHYKDYRKWSWDTLAGNIWMVCLCIWTGHRKDAGILSSHMTSSRYISRRIHRKSSIYFLTTERKRLFLNQP